MTTLNRLAELGITVDFDIPVECYGYDDIKALDRDARRELRTLAEDKMDSYYYGNTNGVTREDYNTYSNIFWTLEAIEDEEYREANMEEFRAYEARMNEPDFDWGFYSDWHKDMFGYRPHRHVIPATEQERNSIYNDWHMERGL